MRASIGGKLARASRRRKSRFQFRDTRLEALELFPCTKKHAGLDVELLAAHNVKLRQPTRQESPHVPFDVARRACLDCLTNAHRKFIQRDPALERPVQRARFEPELLDALVPNLLLQPLVENAVRHGIAPRAAGGKIELRARREGSSLALTIRDDGVGLPQDFCAEACGGVGLRNARARLAQLFPGEHRLEIAAAPGGGAAVTLTIPLVLQEAIHVEA